MNVAILGCGPSGLLAAHAAVLRGLTPTVYSIAVRSELPGTMYFHQPIPDLTGEEPDGTVRFRKVGNAQGYAYKIYGNHLAPSSWQLFDEGEVRAWSMDRVYDELWSRYNELVVHRMVSWEDIRDLQLDYPAIFSSVPAPALCRKPYHKFPVAEIWVDRETAATGVEDGEIVYNGKWDDAWYRSCHIFGRIATEYGTFQDGLPRGIKPMVTNCDCNPNVIRIGRFGKWKKGELVHHAFRDAYRYLEANHRAMHRV